MIEYVREETVVKSEDHGVYRREVVKMSDRREEIVRCRDCEFAFEFEDGEGWPGKLDCARFSPWDYYEDKPGHWPVEPDGFCAWGELDTGRLR